LHLAESFVDAVASALFGDFVRCAFAGQAGGERVGIVDSGKCVAFEKVLIIRFGGKKKSMSRRVKGACAKKLTQLQSINDMESLS
jgi:hypothetical protein